MEIKILHGDIVYARDAEQLAVYPDSYLIAEGAFVKEICTEVPEMYKDIAVEDYGSGLIIPAFSDMHIHASQFIQRGIGMDKLLFDWLNDYTFPQESNFASPEYAKKVYDAVVRELIKHGTFHASLFTTIHYDASDYLFRALEKKGLYAYVGKVNMDCNSPEYLCETTEESLKETERFLAEHQGNSTVQPILTPRFAPTCSEELMKGLGRLAGKYHCGIQTHLCESLAEVQTTLDMYPDYAADAQVYERCGLLGHGPAIFAHYIFPSEKDLEIVRKYNALTVHCPDATTNVTAGIMPVSRLQKKEKIQIGMGTDIGAGQSAAVYRQAARAVQLSKLKEFYELEENERITFEHAFYMATKAGGSVFDRVGSLEPGYRFHALVLDGLEDDGFAMSPKERLERFCYAGDDRNIKSRYLDGKEIFV